MPSCLPFLLDCSSFFFSHLLFLLPNLLLQISANWTWFSRFSEKISKKIYLYFLHILEKKTVTNNLWSSKCQDCHGDERKSAFMTGLANNKEDIGSFSLSEKTKNTKVRWSFLFLRFSKDLMSPYCMPIPSPNCLKFYKW